MLYKKRSFDHIFFNVSSSLAVENTVFEMCYVASTPAMPQEREKMRKYLSICHIKLNDETIKG